VHQAVHVPRLGDVPVLAELACEVASGGAEGEHRASRQELVERLLLDRVDAESRRAPVGGEHHRVAGTRAHEADDALTLAVASFAWAEGALDAAVVEAMPPPRGVERAPEGIGNAGGHANFSTV